LTSTGLFVAGHDFLTLRFDAKRVRECATLVFNAFDNRRGGGHGKFEGGRDTKETLRGSNRKRGRETVKRQDLIFMY
jgi:hypothetical protein